LEPGLDKKPYPGGDRAFEAFSDGLEHGIPLFVEDDPQTHGLGEGLKTSDSFRVVGPAARDQLSERVAKRQDALALLGAQLDALVHDPVIDQPPIHALTSGELVALNAKLAVVSDATLRGIEEIEERSEVLRTRPGTEGAGSGRLPSRSSHDARISRLSRRGRELPHHHHGC